MHAKGLLLVLADPPPTLEEEFNDWYDTEHLPERAALPGFETARRFLGLGDGPRYMAIYDLANRAVLESDAYKAVSGENFSPWTRRVTAKSRPVRFSGVQTYPGNKATGTCVRLLLLRFRPLADADASLILPGLEESFASGPAMLQYRVFACDDPAGEHLAIVEFCSPAIPPLKVKAFGAAAAALDLVATYRPYRA